MTKDEAIAQVKMLLGFRTDLATTIETQLHLAQQHLEDNWNTAEAPLPWFLVTERSTTSTVAEEERLGYPEDLLANIEDDGLFIENTDGQEILLKKFSENDLRVLYVAADPGFPENYAEDGKYYRLFPAPDAAYTVHLKYYAKDVAFNTLTGAQTNLWLTHAPNALIGRAGLLISGAGNNARGQIFAGLLGDALSSIKGIGTNIMTNNRRYAMGETL